MTSGDETPAQAIYREALKLAVEYHGQTAQSHNSKGAAKAETVTATALQFADFMREAADRAGVTAEDFESGSDTAGQPS